MGDKSPKPSEEYSSSTQDVWGPQASGLEDLYSGAGQWYQDTNPGLVQAGQQASAMGQGALNTAAPVWQNQMQGGNLAGYDIAGGLSNSLTGALGGPTQQQQALNTASNGGQNYSNAYKQNFVNDARSAMDASMQGIDARAAASGAGDSAYGNAMARGHQDINSNLQSNLANIGYQDYNNNIQNQMQAGGAADQNLIQQQQMLGSLAQQQNNNVMGAFTANDAVNSYINGPTQGLMNTAAGLQQYQGLLGNPVPLTQQEGFKNGGLPDTSADWSVGTSGANVSF